MTFLINNYNIHYYILKSIVFKFYAGNYTIQEYLIKWLCNLKV
jgi:hypothetical protein